MSNRLNSISYRHLVAYDGSSEGGEAVIAADLLAQRDGAGLTIVAVVDLEPRLLAATRLPRGRSVWNDVLLDAARADLQRAARLTDTPAELTVLFGPARHALPRGAEEFGCDAISASTASEGPPQEAVVTRPGASGTALRALRSSATSLTPRPVARHGPRRRVKAPEENAGLLLAESCRSVDSRSE